MACDSAWWGRVIDSNRFSGGVPSTISALTALTYLYAAEPALPMGPRPTFTPRLLNGSARASLMIGSLAWRLILSNVQKVQRASLLLICLGACDTDCMLACATNGVRACAHMCSSACAFACVRAHRQPDGYRHTGRFELVHGRTRAGGCTRTLSTGLSRQASQRSPGWSTCASPPTVQCQGRFDLATVRRCVVAQGSYQEPLQRCRAVGHLCTDGAHVSVSRRFGIDHHINRPYLLQLLQVLALFPRRFLTSNAFNGPFPEGITALTRLVSLYAPAAVQRRGRFDWRAASNRLGVAVHDLK